MDTIITTQSIMEELKRILPPSSPFIVSHYPFTYANDFIRMFPEIVPQDVRNYYPRISSTNPTRWDADRLRRRWSRIVDMSDKKLAVALAGAYLEYFRIEIS